MFDFKVVAESQETLARAGLMTTLHGTVETGFHACWDPSYRQIPVTGGTLGHWRPDNSREHLSFVS